MGNSECDGQEEGCRQVCKEGSVQVAAGIPSRAHPSWPQDEMVGWGAEGVFGKGGKRVCSS